MQQPIEIKKLNPGDEITGFFVIRKKELRTKKSDGAPYLAFELGNATGRISATLWQDVKEGNEEYRIGSMVKVFGKVIDYKGGHTFVVEKIRMVQPEDKIDPSHFLPKAKRELPELKAELKELLQSVSDPHFSALLHKIFTDAGFLAAYETAPAGKLWHHNRLSGLLEHSLSIASVCDFLCRNNPHVHRDLLITGALLHDIGKIQSYTTRQGFIEYTDEGRLLGHLSIGAGWLEDIISGIQDFPDEKRKQLLHLILSHHGELAKGSPVVPMTLEALILYHVDELDSKMDAFRRITETEKSPERRWSNYVRLLDRFLYFPNDRDENNENSENE